MDLQFRSLRVPGLLPYKAQLLQQPAGSLVLLFKKAINRCQSGLVDPEIQYAVGELVGKPLSPVIPFQLTADLHHGSPGNGIEVGGADKNRALFEPYCPMETFIVAYLPQLILQKQLILLLRHDAEFL